MTLRLIDGFDYFPTGQSDAIRAVIWAAAGYYAHASSSIPDVRVGRYNYGGAMSYPGSTAAANQTKVKSIGILLTEGYLGIAAIRDYSCDTDPIICFYDAAGVDAPQFTVSLCANGVIRLWRGWSFCAGGYSGSPTTGTLIATSAMGVFQDSQWFQLEIHGLIGASAGAVEIRVNTATVINVSPCNNQGSTLTTFDSIGIGDLSAGFGIGLAVNKDYAFDDLWLLDTAGSVNNSWLGNVRVFTQLTSAAGGTTDLSIFGPQPTNWQTVQNKLLNDSQYVFTDVNGNFDLYKFQAVVTGTTIYGVQPKIAMRQDDATQVTAQIELATGSYSGHGSDKTINQSYTYYTDIWEENPDTSLPWTQTDTTLYQFGPKKKT